MPVTLNSTSISLCHRRLKVQQVTLAQLELQATGVLLATQAQLELPVILVQLVLLDRVQQLQVMPR
jgi:hypothetical protein